MTARHRLYVASGNAGKLRDFAIAAERFAADSFGLEGGGQFTLQALPGLEAIPAPAEDALTFAGNARAKAIYYSLRAPGSLVIADDSGLEVDALGGAPGVYSARYAQRAGALRDEPDAANNVHLLAELARVLAPDGVVADLERRTARYRCILAAARDAFAWAPRKVLSQDRFCSRPAARRALVMTRSSTCRRSGRPWLKLTQPRDFDSAIVARPCVRSCPGSRNRSATRKSELGSLRPCYGIVLIRICPA